MVERRAGLDQLAHDAVVAEVRGGDQRGAVVAAGDEPGAGAELEQQRAASLRRRPRRRSSPRRSGRSPARPGRHRRLASARIASRWRAKVATCSGVRPWPSRASTAFGCTFSSAASRTVSPTWAAACNAPKPRTSAALGATCACARAPAPSHATATALAQRLRACENVRRDMRDSCIARCGRRRGLPRDAQRRCERQGRRSRGNGTVARRSGQHATGRPAGRRRMLRWLAPCTRRAARRLSHACTPAISMPAMIGSSNKKPRAGRRAAHA